MRFRTGTIDDVAMLWALRTRCVRETCSSHYPPEVIAPWSASPPPSQYARLLSQGGGVVAEDGQGGLLGFGVKGGYEAGRKIIESLKLFSHVANIGDARSLAIHPASTTHSQLSESEQTDAGVRPDYVRLSLGTEDFPDLQADLEQALAGI